MKLVKIDNKIRQAAGVFKNMPKRIKRLASQVTANWNREYLMYLVNYFSAYSSSSCSTIRGYLGYKCFQTYFVNGKAQAGLSGRRATVVFIAKQ